MDYGLTGLEQYSLERAGYFIRRSAIKNATVNKARETATRLSQHAPQGESSDAWIDEFVRATELSEIRGLAEDLPGCEELRMTIEFICLPSARAAWACGVYLYPSQSHAERMAQLHRGRPTAHILVALATNHSLLVLPGSHAEPPSAEQWNALQADPFAELEGSVRIRLDGGDAIAYNGNLLRRIDPLPDDLFPARQSPTIHYACGFALEIPLSRSETTS